MWTTGGYIQSMVRRHLIEVGEAPDLLPGTDIKLPNILAHKDKLKLTFLTQQKKEDAHAGFLGVALSWPVKVPVYSGRVEKLAIRWKKWLDLPYYRWTVHKSKVRGCVDLYLVFGTQASHLDEAAQQ